MVPDVSNHHQTPCKQGHIPEDLVPYTHRCRCLKNRVMIWR